MNHTLNTELINQHLLGFLRYWGIIEANDMNFLGLFVMMVAVEVSICVTLWYQYNQSYKPQKVCSTHFYVALVGGFVVTLNSFFGYAMLSIGDCTYLKLFTWALDAQAYFLMVTWFSFLLMYFVCSHHVCKQWTLYQVLLLLISDIPMTIASCLGFSINGLTLLTVNALVLIFGYCTYISVKPKLVLLSQALKSIAPENTYNAYKFHIYLYTNLALSRLTIWLTVQIYSPWVTGLHDNVLLKGCLLVVVGFWFVMGFKLLLASVHCSNQTIIP